jgi:hypothetical protein
MIDCFYPMLLKCHHHLHLLLESKSGIADQGVHENYNLVIFKIIANTSKLSKELDNRELLIFKQMYASML